MLCAHLNVASHRGPLSPTLFLVFIDDLITVLLKIGVGCQAFADDLLTWIRGNF